MFLNTQEMWQVYKSFFFKKDKCLYVCHNLVKSQNFNEISYFLQF